MVTLSRHDLSKTVLYIDEYSSLIEKYMEACVVQISRKGLALKAQENLKKQVCVVQSNQGCVCKGGGVEKTYVLSCVVLFKDNAGEF